MADQEVRADVRAAILARSAELGLSFGQLAKDAGIETSRLRHLMGGPLRPLRPHDLELLARVLRINIFESYPPSIAPLANAIAASAVTQLESELAIQSQKHGPDDPETLTARQVIAHLTARLSPADGLQRLEALLGDQVRVLGADDPASLATRDSIAFWTDRAGHPADAMRLVERLLPDLVRVLGPDDVATLDARATVARLTAQTGDKRDAAVSVANLDHRIVVDKPKPDPKGRCVQ